MTVRCVVATMEDAPLVHQIMREAFGARAPLNPPSGAVSETLDDAKSAMLKGGAVLAWEGDTPVGSARFQIESDHLYVGRVAVLPGCQRRGIATSMMRFLEQVACWHQRGALHVTVRMSLPDNIKLYEGLGYTVTSTEAHPRGPDRMAHMKKALACEILSPLPLDDQLRLARNLSRREQHDEALKALKTLESAYPDHPGVQFELACAHDFAGLEAKAAPYYRRAMALGLDGDNLVKAYLGLGSTLRNLGEYAESVRVLREGAARFPDYTALQPFLALSLFSAGDCRDALVVMLELTLAHPNTPEIASYARALRCYTDELRQISDRD